MIKKLKFLSVVSFIIILFVMVSIQSVYAVPTASSGGSTGSTGGIIGGSPTTPIPPALPILPPSSLSSAKEILTFNVNNQNATISGNEITFYSNTNVPNLRPIITVSPKARISPASGAIRDFSTPQTYTVTAEDSSTATYTVKVSFPKSALKRILSFEILGKKGVIDEVAHTIKVIVPKNTYLGFVSPKKITLSSKATINPDPRTGRDFRFPNTYTVTAEDGSTQNYTVSVNYPPQFSDSTLKARNTKMNNLAVTKPTAFYTQAQKDNIFSKITSEEQKKLVEEPVTIEEGIIKIGHADSLTNSTTIPVYSISMDSGKTFKAFIPTNSISSTNSQAIQADVFGYEINDLIVGKVTSQKDYTQSQNYSDNSKNNSTEQLKLAVVLINYKDKASEAVSKSDVEKMVASDSQFNKFYQEQSYNQISFRSDVYGWYTIPENTPSECPLLWVEYDIMDIIQKNVTPNKYDFVYVILHCDGKNAGMGISNLNLGYYRDDNKNSYGEMAIVGSSSQLLTKWGNFKFEWRWIERFLVHEIGHDLGNYFTNGGLRVLPHSRSLDSGDYSLPFPGVPYKIFEYGNFFDGMGSEYFGIHFNGYQKNTLGWIPESKIINITETGAYSLKPLELQGAQIGNIRINNENFYIEYRKPIGFDAELKEGLYLNRSEFNRITLINMNPSKKANNNNIENAQIFNNQTYSNKYFTIGPVLNSGPNESSPITFRVKFNERCDKSIPSINTLLEPSVTDANHKKVNNEFKLSYRFNFYNSWKCYRPWAIKISFPKIFEPKTVLTVNSYKYNLNFNERSDIEVSGFVPEGYGENFIETYLILKKGIKDGKYPIVATFTDVETKETITETKYFIVDTSSKTTKEEKNKYKSS